MLQGDFFNVSDTIVTNHSVLATFNINAAHRIFEGHFPGHPLVPGVCMMQMLKELLENVIEKETRLVKADNMKFLAIINPMENPAIQAELSYTNAEAGIIIVIARLYNGRITFVKFKGQFALKEV
jgi:3-hydroxyacyl-[acyl-carrier-protein] dehydratase